MRDRRPGHERDTLGRVVARGEVPCLRQPDPEGETSYLQQSDTGDQKSRHPQPDTGDQENRLRSRTQVVRRTGDRSQTSSHA